MSDNHTLLEKLDGLVSRFEEVSTLITDPSVITLREAHQGIQRTGRPDEGTQGIHAMPCRTGGS